MELALARYRLLFKHPFGTAHGLRTGTDSVFVRLSQDGRTGYGEITLPPYLHETQSSVYQELVDYWLKSRSTLGPSVVGARSRTELSPPARAGLQVAHSMLNNSVISGINSIANLIDHVGVQGSSMVTLGHTEVVDIEAKLLELPVTKVLKVKLGAANDLLVLDAIKALDDRLLFLDANQGWDDLDQALTALERAGAERVVGLEQPFAKNRWDLHKEFRDRISAPIFGDESIQGMSDLERAPEAFSGVNLQLMKCGGLDVAMEMADRARELGLKVMLGSMSESSLGCAAMATLQGQAEFVDLDGPWLIKNDPFQGMGMVQGRIQTTGSSFCGVDLKLPSPLEFIPVGT